MNPTDQAANAVGGALLAVFIGLLFLFLSYLGYKITSARWPHARALFTLTALGIPAIMVGLIGEWLLPLLPLDPGVADWVSMAGVVTMQIGMLISCIAFSWASILWLFYDLIPYRSSGDRRLGRSQVAGAAALIAAAAGYSTTVVLVWVTNSSQMAIGVGEMVLAFVVVFLPVFPITFFVLNSLLRRQRADK